jgi:hypothetical protein
LETLAEVDDVRKYIPKFVTTDHKVDFQRASHVLSNATPKAMKKVNAKQEVADLSDFEINEDET